MPTVPEQTTSTVVDENAPGNLNDSPLPGAQRFRVDEVLDLYGTGCIVVGELLEGTVRPQMQLRVEPTAGSPSAPNVVTVHSITEHHKSLQEIRPGSKPGIILRGVSKRSWGSRRATWDIQPGDFLVGPP